LSSEAADRTKEAIEKATEASIDEMTVAEAVELELFSEGTVDGMDKSVRETINNILSGGSGDGLQPVVSIESDHPVFLWFCETYASHFDNTETKKAMLDQLVLVGKNLLLFSIDNLRFLTNVTIFEKLMMVEAMREKFGLPGLDIISWIQKSLEPKKDLIDNTLHVYFKELPLAELLSAQQNTAQAFAAALAAVRLDHNLIETAPTFYDDLHNVAFRIFEAFDASNHFMVELAAEAKSNVRIVGEVALHLVSGTNFDMKLVPVLSNELFASVSGLKDSLATFQENDIAIDALEKTLQAAIAANTGITQLQKLPKLETLVQDLEEEVAQQSELVSDVIQQSKTEWEENNDEYKTNQLVTGIGGALGGAIGLAVQAATIYFNPAGATLSGLAKSVADQKDPKAIKTETTTDAKKEPKVEPTTKAKEGETSTQPKKEPEKAKVETPTEPKKDPKVEPKSTEEKVPIEPKTEPKVEPTTKAKEGETSTQPKQEPEKAKEEKAPIKPKIETGEATTESKKEPKTDTSGGKETKVEPKTEPKKGETPTEPKKDPKTESKPESGEGKGTATEPKKETPIDPKKESKTDAGGANKEPKKEAKTETTTDATKLAEAEKRLKWEQRIQLATIAKTSADSVSELGIKLKENYEQRLEGQNADWKKEISDAIAARDAVGQQMMARFTEFEKIVSENAEASSTNAARERTLVVASYALRCLKNVRALFQKQVNFWRLLSTSAENAQSMVAKLDKKMADSNDKWEIVLNALPDIPIYQATVICWSAIKVLASSFNDIMNDQVLLDLRKTWRKTLTCYTVVEAKDLMGKAISTPLKVLPNLFGTVFTLKPDYYPYFGKRCWFDEFTRSSYELWEDTPVDRIDEPSKFAEWSVSVKIADAELDNDEREFLKKRLVLHQMNGRIAALLTPANAETLFEGHPGIIKHFKGCLRLVRGVISPEGKSEQFWETLLSVDSQTEKEQRGMIFSTFSLEDLIFDMASAGYTLGMAAEIVEKKLPDASLESSVLNNLQELGHRIGQQVQDNSSQLQKFRANSQNFLDQWIILFKQVFAGDPKARELFQKMAQSARIMEEDAKAMTVRSKALRDEAALFHRDFSGQKEIQKIIQATGTANKLEAQQKVLQEKQKKIEDLEAKSEEDMKELEALIKTAQEERNENRKSTLILAIFTSICQAPKSTESLLATKDPATKAISGWRGGIAAAKASARSWKRKGNETIRQIAELQGQASVEAEAASKAVVVLNNLLMVQSMLADVQFSLHTLTSFWARIAKFLGRLGSKSDLVEAISFIELSAEDRQEMLSQPAQLHHWKELRSMWSCLYGVCDQYLSLEAKVHLSTFFTWTAGSAGDALSAAALEDVMKNIAAVKEAAD